MRLNWPTGSTLIVILRLLTTSTQIESSASPPRPSATDLGLRGAASSKLRFAPGSAWCMKAAPAAYGVWPPCSCAARSAIPATGSMPKRLPRRAAGFVAHNAAVSGPAVRKWLHPRCSAVSKTVVEPAPDLASHAPPGVGRPVLDPRFGLFGYPPPTRGPQRHVVYAALFSALFIALLAYACFAFAG
jgi:hypothetical protein